MALATSAPLLRLQRLTLKGVRDKPRLAGISFAVNHGESVAVIGPNGSGKSTLLRLLIGEWRADRGTIWFDGQRLDALHRAQRARQIALLAQDESADPRLRVEDYVALGRLPYHAPEHGGEDITIIRQSIADVGIGHLCHARLGELSGGERQRAALARAFAQRPRLLLLDEPTNHLDPLARVQLLAAVRRKGIATLTVLHDLTLAPLCAERIIMLHDGKMVCQGTPDRVFNSRYLQDVFGLRSFQLPHPGNGAPLRVFEPALL
ncbi:ABC transporter ATP-binding protein [Entomohabitans teleogrylli]|uniref:ABC transporter ATP-binding protein n=1 Tax=Entomohabitans teleogrylli TaxID=1384589 RepID=UPI00073DA688|nr:ABC transporter ATP-binding protein [Entomohabitans teleogrylli]